MYPPSDKLFNAPQFEYEPWLDQGLDQPSTIHAGLPSVATGATQTPYFEPTTAYVFHIAQPVSSECRLTPASFYPPDRALRLRMEP
ncbi:hypothetical protein CVT26_003881 [Gymnopilus dilepis]|uniref:Uncharacterized protein n=1 Tax=Gymnopilus dilepis TaxID=231916 RepID=A0A409WYG6_9AGAR|nr:hypothetical protein CVT26_003881 [Gymnopilus dilepis]